MAQIIISLILLIVLLQSLLLTTSASIYDDDYWYCRRVPGQYKICRKCPTLEESCERPGPDDGCYCENIELQANDKSKDRHFKTSYLYRYIFCFCI